MKSFTEAQLKKIVDMPEWMFDKNGNMLPRYEGRVFASNEGWMYRPTKVHPEFPAKQMPAYCISAIPELSKLMEQAGSDTLQTQETVRGMTSTAAYINSMTSIRRSASRYMVDVSFDEEILADGGPVVFEISGLSGISSGDQYTLAADEKTGTLRFDLRFGSPLTIAQTVNPGNISIISGNLRNADRGSVISSLDSSGASAISIGG